jgi:hypothetical protein
MGLVWVALLPVGVRLRFVVPLDLLLLQAVSDTAIMQPLLAL